MRKFSLIFLLISALLQIAESVSAQSCYFKDQSVNMKIENGFLMVSGMYFVSGSLGEASTVIFPVPNGSNYGKVDSLHVFDVSATKYLETNFLNEESILFSLDFENTDQYLIQVYYRVKLLGNYAEYPFSYNAGGTKKVDKASFYLIAPREMDVRRFSYTPKDTIDAGSNMVYYWEMYDFAPETNFEFRFRH